MEEREILCAEKQTIICPECAKIQEAEVVWYRGDPSPYYTHTCIGCGYEILESEWNEVGDMAVPNQLNTNNTKQGATSMSELNKNQTPGPPIPGAGEVMGVSGIQAGPAGTAEGSGPIDENAKQQAFPPEGISAALVNKIAAEALKQQSAAADRILELFDEAYDKIARAIFTEDGLNLNDGQEMLDKIESLIGRSPAVSNWKYGNSVVQ
jgi:hypothetical protein